MNQIQILLNTAKYKSAPDSDSLVGFSLYETSKEIIEFDRSIDINLQQVFDQERQNSTTFRPTAKFTLLFLNSYSGYTTYTPLNNNLYYVNEEISKAAVCGWNTNNVYWSGFPQYNEFDFIRTDYDLSGYTKPPNNHINFVQKSATTYNWNFFLSYPFENDYNKKLEAIDEETGVLISWESGDGIPFVVKKSTYNGRDIISFRCPMKHGLTIGEYVNLSFNYNGQSLFQVDFLGNNKFESDEYIFNIYDVGFTGNTFNNGTIGTFKRVTNPRNSGETTSKYYIRKHKIITDINDSVLTKTGFDLNIFGNKRKYESSGFTPNKISRISTKEGAQCYNLSFNRDIDINNLIDNQKRPITELFFTTIWKGYFGLMFGTKKSNGVDYVGLKQGYEFNLPLNPNTNTPTTWWSKNNTKSDTNFIVDVYNTSMGAIGGPNNGPIPFTYIRTPQSGDTLDGDFCEWNDYEQTERVISDLYHKFTYNPFVFKTSIPNQTPLNPFGFYYKPNTSITLKVYSDYIENGDKKTTIGIPNYAFFSQNDNSFIWRDIYPYGYIQNGIGVDYPFLNGSHYPYKDITFRIIPEGTNYEQQIIVEEPIIDPCE